MSEPELLRTAFLSGKPPSSNQLYANTHKGRFLTREGKKYINDTSAVLGHQWLTDDPLDPQAPYEVHLIFYIDLLNATYGAPKGAQNRFKKIDLTGLVKLLEDVIVKMTGVDDANTVRMVLEKWHCPFDPHVEIALYGGEALEAHTKVC